ncbi:MAG: tetratricopeptide repeat protein [Candidatus Saccharimonas sp.]|nr:tetratricopeptide repeat protein [Planctomycetaceae bacterium]
MTVESRVSCPKPRWLGVTLVLIVIVVAVGYRLVRPPLSALLLNARTALSTGDADIAIEKIRQVVARSPESVDGWILMAQAGVLAKDRTVWEPAIEKVERSSPSEALALWVKIGGQEMRSLHAAPAEHALRRAIAISCDRPEPWRLLAQLLSVQGRPRETAECLLALIRLGDFTSGDLHTLAWPNSAIDDPSRVSALLEADPQNLVPMLGRVGAALNENRTADAERYLKSILSRHSDNSRAIAMLGALLADRDAAEFPQWQRDQSPHAVVEPETWIAQGIWLRNHGQLSAAARCFRQAAELDPRHLNALSELGQTMRALGESSLAATFLGWARQQQEISELAKRLQEQGEPQHMRMLVERLEQVGRLWEASAWCRLYVNANPQDTVATNDLARLKSRLTPDLPRTAPGALPGREFDWSGT